MQVVRKRRGGGALGSAPGLVHEPLVGPSRLEQVVPPLGYRTHRHFLP